MYSMTYEMFFTIVGEELRKDILNNIERVITEATGAKPTYAERAYLKAFLARVPLTSKGLASAQAFDNVHVASFPNPSQSVQSSAVDNKRPDVRVSHIPGVLMKGWRRVDNGVVSYFPLIRSVGVIPPDTPDVKKSKFYECMDIDKKYGAFIRSMSPQVAENTKAIFDLVKKMYEESVTVEATNV